MQKLIARPLALLLGALFALLVFAPVAGAGNDPYAETGGENQGGSGDGEVLGETGSTGGTTNGSTGGTTSGSSGGALAVTGGEAAMLALIGIAFLASGAVIVTVAKRRAATVA